MTMNNLPDEHGRFGEFGGRYVPETLMTALEELERAYEAAKADPAFAGRAAHLAARLRRPADAAVLRREPDAGAGRRASIYLKREDLAHTGAHKINNALGQGLLAKRLGKPRIIAETGAGQHGVATATICAHLGLECVVYMGERRHGAPGAQRLPHAAARRRGASRRPAAAAR